MSKKTKKGRDWSQFEQKPREFSQITNKYYNEPVWSTQNNESNPLKSKMQVDERFVEGKPLPENPNRRKQEEWFTPSKGKAMRRMTNKQLGKIRARSNQRAEQRFRKTPLSRSERIFWNKCRKVKQYLIQDLKNFRLTSIHSALRKILQLILEQEQFAHTYEYKELFHHIQRQLDKIHSKRWWRDI